MLRTTSYDEVTRFDLARTLAGRGRYWTTAYLVDGLLIDSGCAHSAPELVAVLADVPLRGIVNTHSHEDHFGANGQLQGQRPDLPVQAHPLALPVLAAPRSRQPLQFYRRLMWGWPQPCQGQPIDGGDVVESEHFRFQVVETPGHSPDHLCLYEPDQGWLYTGDLFVGGRDRALRADYDIWAIIDSFKRVAGLPGKTKLFPGCARVRDNPEVALADKIAYLEELGDRVMALHQEGWGVNRIARQLLGRPIWIEFITLGHFSRRNLVRSYLNMNGGVAESSKETSE
ncbi:MAG: MBL fold metallo-hydrolase [Chloroflexota bacterium]|nr:MAG: MBL fold metallo-hydrolase [Chloroflexota bacterium]